MILVLLALLSMLGVSLKLRLRPLRREALSVLIVLLILFSGTGIARVLSFASQAALGNLVLCTDAVFEQAAAKIVASQLQDKEHVVQRLRELREANKQERDRIQNLLITEDKAKNWVSNRHVACLRLGGEVIQGLPTDERISRLVQDAACLPEIEAIEPVKAIDPLDIGGIKVESVNPQRDALGEAYNPQLAELMRTMSSAYPRNYGRLREDYKPGIPRYREPKIELKRDAKI